MMAISDLLSGRKEDAYRAGEWLFNTRRDFYMICDLAGLNPESVQARAAALQGMKRAGTLPAYIKNMDSKYSRTYGLTAARRGRRLTAPRSSGNA